jgi:hypothetical protein
MRWRALGVGLVWVWYITARWLSPRVFGFPRLRLVGGERGPFRWPASPEFANGKARLTLTVAADRGRKGEVVVSSSTSAQWGREAVLIFGRGRFRMIPTAAALPLRRAVACRRWWTTGVCDTGVRSPIHRFSYQLFGNFGSLYRRFGSL